MIFDKTFWTLFFGIVGGLIVAITSIIQYREKRESEEEIIREKSNTENFRNKLTESQIKIIELQKQNIDTAKEIIHLQAILGIKNDKIQELQDETIKHVTGDQTVPRVWFIISGGKGLVVQVINRGKYSIKNVSINIERHTTDYHVWDSNGNGRTNNPDAVKIYDFPNIGDIPANQHKTVLEYFYQREYNNLTYRYVVRWANGYFKGLVEMDNGNSNTPKFSNAMIYSFTKGIDVTNAVDFGGLIKNRVRENPLHE